MSQHRMSLGIRTQLEVWVESRVTLCQEQAARSHPSPTIRSSVALLVLQALSPLDSRSRSRPSRVPCQLRPPSQRRLCRRRLRSLTCGSLPSPNLTLSFPLAHHQCRSDGHTKSRIREFVVLSALMVSTMKMSLLLTLSLRLRASGISHFLQPLPSCQCSVQKSHHKPPQAGAQASSTRRPCHLRTRPRRATRWTLPTTSIL